MSPRESKVILSHCRERENAYPGFDRRLAGVHPPPPRSWPSMGLGRRAERESPPALILNFEKKVNKWAWPNTIKNKWAWPNRTKNINGPDSQLKQV